MEQGLRGRGRCGDWDQPTWPPLPLPRCRRRRPMLGAAPAAHSPAPALTAQLRCQLFCKSWRHALNAQRWPLGQLALVAEAPTFIPPRAALWVQRAQPGVQRLRIELSGDELYSEEGPLDVDNPTVEAVYDALLALQPSVSCAGLRVGMPIAAHRCLGGNAADRGLMECIACSKL